MTNATVQGPDVVARRSNAENLANIKDSLTEIGATEKERVQGAWAKGKDRLQKMEQGFESYVSEHPVKSVLIAAGTGLAIGWLIARRR